jgi:23S rRNA (uracil1939-C5)-methyltransferase
MSPPPGSLHELLITDLDDEGRGVADLGGWRALVEGGATGDRVRARVEHVNRRQRVAFARAVAVLAPGPLHQRPPCHHAAPLRGRCGGCPLMHLRPEAQHALKRRALGAALAARGLEVEASWHPAPAALGWRNRGHYIPFRNTENKVRSGSYAPRSHELAAMGGCLVVRPAVAAEAAALEALLEAQGVPLGEAPEALRSFTLRSDPAGRVLVELVARAASPGWLGPLAAALMAREAVVGVSASVNEGEGNALRVGPSVWVAGQATVIEPLGDLEIALGAGSFSQLNPAVAASMAAVAASWAPESGDVLDLYCGAGALGLRVARGRPEVRLWGAEVSAEAVALARENAARAGVEACFEALDLALPLPAAWPPREPALVLLNPPRRGLDEAVVGWLCAPARRARLVYMSCSAASFARDAAALAGAGWRLEALEAHEMLPQTVHVELLATFTRL